MIDVNLNVPLLEKMWDTLDKRFIATWMNPKRIEREGAARLKVERDQRLQAIEFQRRELDASIGGELAVAGEPYIDFQRLSEVERQQEYIRKQTNLGKSILHAEDVIKADDPVPEKEVDPDWLYRWKEQAEKFSADDMQLLWGRVLAGEFKSPGSFNYRTLDVLSGLSKKDAEIFLTLCSLAFPKEGIVFIFGSSEVNRKYGLTHLSLLRLRELGLLSHTDTEFRISEKELFVFENNMKAVQWIPKKEIYFYICLFTSVGQSLYGLVDVDFNVSYARDILNENLKEDGVESIIMHNIRLSPDGKQVSCHKSDMEEFRIPEGNKRS